MFAGYFSHIAPISICPGRPNGRPSSRVSVCPAPALRHLARRPGTGDDPQAAAAGTARLGHAAAGFRVERRSWQARKSTIERVPPRFRPRPQHWPGLRRLDSDGVRLGRKQGFGPHGSWPASVPVARTRTKGVTESTLARPSRPAYHSSRASVCGGWPRHMYAGMAAPRRP